MADAVIDKVLQTLDSAGIIEDSTEFARKLGFEHQTVVGALKSLESTSTIRTETSERKGWEVSEEGRTYVESGSPEFLVFLKLKKGEAKTQKDLEAQLGAGVAKIGFSQGMQQKWFQINKGTGEIVVQVESVVDKVQEAIQCVTSGNVESLDPKDLEGLKKRKLVAPVTTKVFRVFKGENFTTQRTKAATDITAEMIASGSWKTTSFKQYNFNALGVAPAGGVLHPLLKVRGEFRKIFIELGFEEMATNNFVESSFWNFDALFQPQQHPARDAHDTFFLKTPASALSFPEDYVQRVKEVHENGGHGSIGYRYDWKIEEAKKNILRTHTTAVSSRYLYNLAQEYKEKGFTPRKYFSIDRVFRNEVMDATHLCEFHQIEGMVIDKNLSLGNMIGLFSEFFAKIGITNLKFKPAYNPYTEPSMEIFGYHPLLKKWVEIGNSGIFRPEMLEPMGLPSDVRVLAWGLSTERPTMILYGISNIRDLVGHKVDLEMIKHNPLCRLDKAQ